MNRKVRCIGCKFLSGISQMGYRYCGAMHHADNRIRDVRLVPGHCPINEQIAAENRGVVDNSTQQSKCKIRARYSEYGVGVL
jgi:hypothetical protein